MTKVCRSFTGVLIGLVAISAAAENTSGDTRTQYPKFLANSYFSLNVGAIRYRFSARQVEPGFEVGSIQIPRPAVRVDLLGHHFTRYVSAQLTYMRPGQFVSFHDVSGNSGKVAIGQVWAAYGGLTLVSHIPLSSHISVYGEGGVGITSRKGFKINGKYAVRDAHFSSILAGGGLEYHATPKIDVVLGATYLPARKSYEQPSTQLFTTGVRYNIRALPPEVAQSNAEAGFKYPANLVRFGYTKDVTYGPNNFITNKVHLFWDGTTLTRSGVTVEYERNLFHTKRRFGFDVGASISSWRSGNGETFRTVSAYPVLRFFLARTQSADLYAVYSLAGPTRINKKVIDGNDLGEHFTFQDFIAAGAFLGKARRINTQIGIKHFSNGGMFPQNSAVTVPLTLSVGMTF